MTREAMDRVRRIADSMKSHRQDFEPHYNLLEQYFLPRRGAFSSDPSGAQQSKRGGLVNGKMVDSTPIRATRISQSGMQAGITSPARPWFRLLPQDRSLREFKSVKAHLESAEHEMRRLAERSGLYNMLHVGYRDLLVYGTEAGLIEDHGTNSFRCMELVPGSYWLGSSDEITIDTLYREFMLTINQIVGKFVFKGNRYGEPDWNVVPRRVKNLYDKGDVSESMACCQLITPRHERDERLMTPSNKPIASQYWLKNEDRPSGEQYLAGDLGYDESPLSVSRWDVMATDAYGLSPAMDALPDVRELMLKRREFSELLRRLNRPPMNASADLANSRFSLLPNAVNFMADPSKGLVPTFRSEPRLGELAQDIELSKEAVWSGMYADLFLMISQLDRRQITATEIMERKEEKLIALGPVLERLHFEKLRPLVERMYKRVVESGNVVPPPKELQNQELEVDFVSMLAQAQKAVATGAVERFAAFVGNIAAGKPTVLDKLDEDQAVDEYADMLGVPASIVRSDDEVVSIREERQRQLQVQQATEQALNATQAMQQGAQAAKVLSEADSPRAAAPGDVLRRIGVGG